MGSEDPVEAIDGLLADHDFDSVALQGSIGRWKLERYLEDRTG